MRVTIRVDRLVWESKLSNVLAIDLFAGAGGLSLGAQRAGVEVRVAVELDAGACQTLQANPQHLATKVVQADIGALRGHDLRAMADVGRRDRLIVIGGPPCQPFSKAAYWLDDGDDSRYRRARARGEDAPRPSSDHHPRYDPRRSLVGELLRVAIEARADAFLLENVPSLLHPRNHAELQGLLDGAIEAGFRVRVVLGNAAEHGVPQRRERVFVLATHGVEAVAPEPTHSLSQDPSALGLLRAVTAGEALESFSGEKYVEDGETVQGRWAAKFREVPPGWNYKFHTAWANHPSPTFITETRFWNFLLKLDPALPSWTLPANPGPWVGPFHWDDRRLRTVELASLQGFPTGYVFVGNRRERVRQIGNAVPPLLAARMIGQVLKTLDLGGQAQVP